MIFRKPIHVQMSKGDYADLFGKLCQITEAQKSHTIDPFVEAERDNVVTWLSKTIFFIRVLEKRLNFSRTEVDKLEGELIVRKSKNKNQIKLITKCGCEQYVEGSYPGNEYIIPLVGMSRKFRKSTEMEGLAIYEEV